MGGSHDHHDDDDEHEGPIVLGTSDRDERLVFVGTRLVHRLP